MSNPNVNLDEEMQKVIAALSTIYSTNINNNINTTTREQANQYLTQYQRNAIAWQISDRLLSTNTSSDATIQTQIYFFAAQTIRTKCRSDMMQLPTDSWTSLRSSLMNHYIKFSAGGSAGGNIGGNMGINSGSQQLVGRYLASALCVLSVQMQWYDIVDELLLKEAKNNSNNNHNHINVHNMQNLGLVLEMAQLLPEEATSYRLLVQDSNIRQGFIQGLVDKSPEVFGFYYSIICQYGATAGVAANTNGNGNAVMDSIQITPAVLKVREQILRCIHAWVRYIHIPAKLLHDTPLIDWVFSILQSHDLNNENENDNDHDNDNDDGYIDTGDMFELAVDVIIEILRCYPSDAQENVGLVHKMIPLVMALAQQSQNQQQGQQQTQLQNQNQQQLTPFQKALQNQDEDGMRAYCRIFTEMGESYMSLIMHHEDLNQVALVELVLNCSSLPDHEIATITLHFWYRFVSWLEDMQPYEFRQYQIDNFAPQINKLVAICTTLLQYPIDIDTLLQDKIDDVHRVRLSVSDTVEDCCRLLGGDLVLQNIGHKLQEEISRLSTLPPEQRLLQWHGIESCLLALKSASRYIPSDEAQVLPFVMKLLPDLPTTVSHLRTTANHVVGGYAPWLAAHGDYLQPILPFLAQGLSEKNCASSAAVAIRYLCESCSSSFALGDSVLTLYNGILQAQQQQNNSVLEIKDELQVLEGACVAVSRQLDDMVKKATHQEAQQVLPDTISQYVSRIVGPIGNQLVQFAEPSNTAGPKQVIAEVERLTVVIRCLKVPDPVTGTTGANSPAARAKLIVDLMTQCWTWLDNLSQKFPSDIHFAEKLCRLHKHCIRGCGANLYKPLFEKLCVQLVTNFSRSHLSPYLYAASICISEYGSDPSYEQYLFQTFEAMANASFVLLQTDINFRDHPDLVEELFFLVVRMVKSCPRPFISNPLFHACINRATIGMKQDHRDANRGTLNFLEVSFAHGVDLQKVTSNDAASLACRESLEKAVAAEGQQIVTNLILSLLGDLPCYRVACNQGSVAGILYKLNSLCPALLMEWIKVPLASVPEGAKPMLADAFSKRSRNEFFDSIEKFASVCDQNQKMGR